MARKLTCFSVLPREGGFILNATLENPDNANDTIMDEYVVPSYARLLKAFKDEFKDYRPRRKPRKPKEVA